MDKYRTIFKFLKNVKNRPYMLGTVSFNRIYHYIAGYKFCLYSYQDIIESDELDSIDLFFSKFNEYLERHLGEPHSWGTTALLIASVLPENQVKSQEQVENEINDPKLDEKVFYKFFELYDDFLKQNENNRPEWFI